MSEDPQPPIGEDDLQAWVDDRLAPARLAEVEAWLARNPAEATRVARYRGQRDQLRAWLAPKAAEPVPARLHPETLRARRWAAWRRQGGAAAAAIVLLLAGGAAGWFARGPRVGVPVDAAALSALLTADAMQAYLTFVPEVRHPVEVQAVQEAHLVAWLSNRLGRPLRVPNLAPLGFQLMGGRLLPSETVPAAQFMYEDAHGTRLTLYMRAEAGKGGTGFELIERAGVAGFRWFDGGFGYAVLAEMDRSRLLRVAEEVHRQMPAAPPSSGEPGRAPF